MIDWIDPAQRLPGDRERVMCSGPGWVAPDCLHVEGVGFVQRVDNALEGEGAYRSPTVDPSDPKLERKLPIGRWMWGPRLSPARWASFPGPAVPLAPSPGGPATPKGLPEEELRAMSERIGAYLGQRPRQPDRDGLQALQELDANCNDCAHLQRMFGPEAMAARGVFHGGCRLKGVRVTFMPATSMPCNLGCFVHRRAGPSVKNGPG